MSKLQAIITLICCLFCLGWVSSAQAEEPRTGGVELTHNGQEGFWFPRPTAIRILANLKQLEGFRSIVEKLEHQIALDKKIEDLYKADAKANAKITKICWDTVEQLKPQKVEKSSSWWPPVLLGTGVVLGIATTILTAVVMPTR